MSWLYTIIFGGLLFGSQGGELTKPVLPNIDTATVAAVTDENERFEKTYPLNPNGRVCVSNVDGSIVVEAWDRNEVKLEYTKTAATKERLAEVEIRIDASPERIEVETMHDSWKSRDGRNWRNSERVVVEYRLMVPRTAFLDEIETVNGSVTVSNFTNFTKLSAVNGEVKATNLRGVANLSTVNGEVDADFDKLETGGKIVLSTVNGRVNLLIPSDSNATINADTVNGNIRNDFGLTVRKGKYVGRDLAGRLGSGDVKIKLDSVNGGLTIGRKKDGKNLSPVVNLLPLKDKDEDWEDGEDPDDSESVVKKVEVDQAVKAKSAAKANADIDRAIKQSQKEQAKALKQAQKELADLQPQLSELSEEAIASAEDSVALATKVVNSAEVQKRINEALERERDAMARSASDAFFRTSLPRVKSKTGSFAVKGVPTVTVFAEPCEVKVTGWDKNEVQYRVVQFVEPRRADPLKVTDEHTDSSVKITVDEPKEDNGQRYYGDGVRTRIEVFVPRKSNLNINANRGIRIEGVTGNVKLVGSDGSVSVIDGQGSLNIENSDGLVRVIGFRGDVSAQTSDGDISLDGDFTKLSATASDGSIMLTLPENISADIESNCPDVTGDGIELSRVDKDEEPFFYRIGKGGRKFELHSEGEIQVRASSVINTR